MQVPHGIDFERIITVDAGTRILGVVQSINEHVFAALLGIFGCKQVRLSTGRVNGGPGDWIIRIEFLGPTRIHLGFFVLAFFEEGVVLLHQLGNLLLLGLLHLGRACQVLLRRVVLAGLEFFEIALMLQCPELL